MNRPVVAIIQARMGSSRLPGKVLEPLMGEPLILRQLERVGRARELDGIVVATSTDPRDDRLAEVVAAAGVPVHRGSELDVLERYRDAAREARAQTIVRLTGDCPLIDPAVIDDVVLEARASGAHFTSNSLAQTYPDGMDVEVFSREMLELAAREARLPSEREHVTFYFWGSGRFRVHRVRSERPLPPMRLAVDYPEDLAMVRLVYERLAPANPEFGLGDIAALVEELGETPNGHIVRNTGWRAALAQDREA